MNKARVLIDAVLAGSMSEVDCEIELEILQVRGCFSETGYIGYNYDQQCWIRIEA